MIHQMRQGSEEWFAVRCGKVTASRVVDILKGAKGAYLAARKNYMAELLIERLTGEPTETFISAPMRWGTETEPLARGAFEALEGLEVKEVGFVDHPTIKNFGASPDSLTEDGGLEIKCPNTSTHLELIDGGKIKRDYMIQMHVNMMCCEMGRWHYVDYDPRLPAPLDYYHKVIERDTALVAEIESEVRLFLAELDAKEKKYRGMME